MQFKMVYRILRNDKSSIFHKVINHGTVYYFCCRALARQHTILDIHLRPVSFAELCIVVVNRDLFKIWMSVGKPGGHGG
jgi:hypothetical protein